MKIDYDLLHLGWDAFSLDFFFELLPEDHGFTDEQVERIWETSHMSIDDIRKAAGLTQAAMAKRFDIPKRTIENWCRKVTRPPEYIRFMFLEILGLLDI